MSADTLLDIQNLQVAYPARTGGWNTVVRDVSFTLGRERLAIVGESGSGKSQTGRAILGLSAAGARIQADRMQFSGIDLLAASDQQRRELRGGRMAMILQDPKYSLNPVMRVGQQIMETVQAHQTCSSAQARAAALDMLSAVAIDQPERVFNLYPHEISGGMGQRVMIAMMLVTGPELLIADEPTSALDVTVQLEVLRILDDLVRSRGMGLIFISHDLRLVSSFCDRVLVMYAGRVVEQIEAERLHEAKHPYTQGLLNCVPRLGASRHPLPTLQREISWSE